MFQKLKGVEAVVSGYTGGTVVNPSYAEVCSEMTGHAEAIDVIFDPKVVSYDTLLEVFWKTHDALFASAPKLEDADLERIAKDAGADPKKALAAVASKKYDAALDVDADLADDMNVSGTPHFFINGRRIAGAQAFERFQGIIDEEIARVALSSRPATSPRPQRPARTRPQPPQPQRLQQCQCRQNRHGRPRVAHSRH